MTSKRAKDRRFRRGKHIGNLSRRELVEMTATEQAADGWIRRALDRARR